MTLKSLKPLGGVAHDIAHHSQSFFSYLHPHLSQACRTVGTDIVQVDLLDVDPYPAGLPRWKPLETALPNLLPMFWKILDATGLDRTRVKSVRLRFEFTENRSDDHSCAVECEIASSDGKIFKHLVP